MLQCQTISTIANRAHGAPSRQSAGCSGSHHMVKVLRSIPQECNLGMISMKNNEVKGAIKCSVLFWNTIAGVASARPGMFIVSRYQTYLQNEWNIDRWPDCLKAWHDPFWLCPSMVCSDMMVMCLVWCEVQQIPQTICWWIWVAGLMPTHQPDANHSTMGRLPVLGWAQHIFNFILPQAIFLIFTALYVYIINSKPYHDLS